MFYVGASVKGLGHKQYSEECEDFSLVGTVNGFEIAVICDGAGSAKYGKEAAQIYGEAFFNYFHLKIEENKFNPKDYYAFPDKLVTYTNEFFPILLDLIHKNIKDVDQYQSTIILSISSSDGFLLFHVGDGRACFRDKNGNWKNIFHPHKGEYINQTYFLNDFMNLPSDLKLTYCLKEDITGISILSDGCENSTYIQQEGTPFFDFFEPNYRSLLQFQKSGFGTAEASEIWFNYLQEGSKSLKDEPDDKSLILVVY